MLQVCKSHKAFSVGMCVVYDPCSESVPHLFHIVLMLFLYGILVQPFWWSSCMLCCWPNFNDFNGFGWSKEVICAIHVTLCCMNWMVTLVLRKFLWHGSCFGIRLVAWLKFGVKFLIILRDFPWQLSPEGLGSNVPLMFLFFLCRYSLVFFFYVKEDPPILQI